MTDLRLPFDGPSGADAGAPPSDAAGRARAVDPRFNVALEASAGTGKTRVLVDRYVNLLRAGVDPRNILAITFTRKAAAEMRQRIMTTLRAAGERGELPAARWRELRDRTADISISTIDAFCLSLLREFPLEADVDPGFSVADATELPRLVGEALDSALRTCRAVAQRDETVALAFSQLGDRRVRNALTVLLDRRIVAPEILAGFLRATGAVDLDTASVVQRAAKDVMGMFQSMRGGLGRFLETGPLEPPFLLLARRLRQVRAALDADEALDPAVVQATFSRLRDHFLTLNGEPRSRSPYPKSAFASEADWRAHRDLVVLHARAMAAVSLSYRRELNALVSRGLWKMFRIAVDEHRRTLDAHAVLDFSDLLLKALELLRRMEDFARSRYRLESRYHHVLVDEFQDTSRAQWDLVSLLIQSWGEGVGLAHAGPLPPSIFIVGDRKQSIYGFRDADVTVLREAARYLEGLRPEGDVRRTITHSFRSVGALLALVNDICADMDKLPVRPDAFTYEETDRFPADDAVATDGQLGLVVADSPEACAELTALEIARLLASGTTVRDRATGVPRAIRPADVGILFRTRESHREFEAALERHDIRSYVYKGLGFFDADEIKDVLALVWYLADSESDLRAAALLRSRLFGLSDDALRLLSPGLSSMLNAGPPEALLARLTRADVRSFTEARNATRRWRELVDRVPPVELVDLAMRESAYAYELRGPRYPQARENLKKIRSLLRRMQNRGYATFARLAAHLDRLAVGDEANAAIDAVDAVNLMTIHAAKGLEFPVVFLVNLSGGSGGRRHPIRMVAESSGAASGVSIGDFRSEVDDDGVFREREETKRLLYVALTRARDRLYLGSVLKDGKIQPGRGSLAEVLPAALLTQIVAGADVVQWQASSGRVHHFRVCRPSGDEDREHSVRPAATIPTVGSGVADMTGDFGPLVDIEPSPRSVATVIESVPVTAERSERSAERVAFGRLVGTLVHRLLQRLGFVQSPDSSVLRAAVTRLLTPAEAATLTSGDAWDALATEAVGAYLALCGRSDIRQVYESGERLHEVPFTMRVDGAVVRGVIDCLVRDRDDHVTLLEFKTGRPQETHTAQLELYRRAAQGIFPGATVDARLVYARA